MRGKFITLFVIVLFGSVKVSSAGLEDYGKWFQEGNGTWSLESGELSLETGKQQFYLLRKTDAQDNFTLKLRAKVISPHNNDIVVYFCDGHYKLILGGWGDTQSGLYRRDRYFTGEWKPLCLNTDFRLTSDTWNDIEIQKYGEYITILVNYEQMFTTMDYYPRKGFWIGIGTYDSHIHFDDIEVSIDRGVVSKSQTRNKYPPKDTSVLSHMFMTEKALENYPFSSETYFNSYIKQRTIDGSRDEDDLPNPLWHFYNPTTGKGLCYPFQYDSTLERTKYLWKTWVIDTYSKGEKYHTYHALGRIAHLLEDMTSPAHTHLIAHPPGIDEYYEEYCKVTSSGSTYTTSGSVYYSTLDDFFYNTALLSWGSATDTINGISPAAVNDIINNTYGRPEGNNNYASYLNSQAYLTNARMDTLARYLVPGTIQRVAGLFKYFWDNKPTIDPDYINLYSARWEDQNGSLEIDVRDSVTHRVKITNYGNPTNVKVIIDIKWQDGNYNWYDFSKSETNISLNPGEEQDIVITPAKQVPLEARKLEARYILQYKFEDENVIHEPIASSVSVSAAKLDVTVTPQEIRIIQQPPQPVSITFTVRDKSTGKPIQGAKVNLYKNEYGIPPQDNTTNPSGQVSFSGNLNKEANGVIPYDVDASNIGNYDRYWGSIVVIDKHAPIITQQPWFGTITWNYADIQWTTHEDATSIVEYGTTTNYGLIRRNMLFKKDHQLILSGLIPATLYYYQVTTTDRADNTTQTSDLTFLSNPNGVSPKLEILSPQADAVWKDVQNIKWWISAHHPGTITIEIGPPGKDEWGSNTIIFVPFAEGTYTQECPFNTWDVKDGEYQFQLSAIDEAGGCMMTTSGRFRICNLPSASKVFPPRPNPSSSKVYIPYQLASPAHIKIEFYDSFGYLRTIDLGVKPGGFYLERNNAASLSIDNDKPGVYYAVFYVNDKTTIYSIAKLYGYDEDVNLSSPKQGNVYSGPVKITWNTSNISGGNINLYYSKDGGYNWNTIATNISNTGNYQWDTAQILDGSNYRVMIKAIDGNIWSEDYCGIFSILNNPPKPPLVKIISPVKGDVLSGIVDIKWEASDPENNPLSIHIHYYKDGNWLPIALKEENDGSYSLDTTQVSDGLYELRVVADNGTLIAGTTTSIIEILNTSINGQGWSDKINICSLTEKKWSDATIDTYNNIAINENLVCMVWEMEGYLCFRQSTNGGDTWSSIERIYNGEVYEPTVNIDNNKNIHIVWTGNGLYYIRRNTNGVWTLPQRISDSPNRYGYPAIVIEGNNIHIAWLKGLDNFYKKSSDFGNTWGEEKCLVQYSSSGPDKGSSRGWKQFKISTKDNDIYLIWSKFVSFKVEELWLKRSTDGGENWGKGIHIGTMSLAPFAIKVDNEKIYVVYNRDKERDRTFEIYCQRSIDKGFTWEREVMVAYNVNVGIALRQWVMMDIDKFGDYLYLIWGISEGYGVAGIGGKIGDIYYMRSKDGINWENKVGFAYNDDKKSVLPAIVAGKNRLHVSWYEGTPGLDKGIDIYYRYKLLDITSPNKPVVIDAGRYTGTNTQLHASWYSKDDESGIREYQYAIGSSQGQEDVLVWTSAGTNTCGTVTSLNLQNGKTYYFSVRARNGGGLYSEEGCSDGITVDVTPPSIPIATDEGTYTTINKLAGNWQAQDLESPVNYYYAIGTKQGGTDTVDWQSAGQSTGVVHADINLSLGKTYYFAVKARNNAGLWSREPGYGKGITFIQPKLTSIIPASGTIGAMVTLQGEGYLPNEQIRIDFGVIKSIAMVVANELGSFTVTFTINSQGYGIKTITATGLLSNVSCHEVFDIKPNFVSISGKVVDSMTNQIIPQTVIEIIQNGNLKATAITDSSGNYKIDNLPQGIYQIQAKGEVICRKWIQVRVGWWRWRWIEIVWRRLEYIPHIKHNVELNSNNNQVDFYLSKASWVEVARVDEGNVINTNEKKNIDVSIKVNYDPEYWFYLYPQDASGYEIRNFAREPIGENGCIRRVWYKWWFWSWYRDIWYNIDYDNGTYIDKVNNRLHVKVLIGGTWWRTAYFNYRYFIDCKAKSFSNSKSIAIVSQEPRKRLKTSIGKVKLEINKIPDSSTKALADEKNIVSVMIKDVEDSLTTAKIRLKFDPNKITLEETKAPALPDPTLCVFVGEQLDEAKGIAKIESLIVHKEQLIGTYTEILENMTLQQTRQEIATNTDTADIQAEENIAPIAYLIITPKVTKTLGTTPLSLEDMLSCIEIEDVELRNAQGEKIEVNVEEKPPKPLYESNLDYAYCYPNPTNKGWITFAKLTQAVKVRIFNIAGELVYEGEHTTNGEWTWKCVNNDGKKVASGIYIYILQDPVSGSMKRSKLGVVR